jgi:MFS family permease
MFWSVGAGTIFTLGCTLASKFDTYYAMKALQGFTFTAGQTSGLAFIQDTFFFHEQARKIGIWTSFFLASPYFGPLFANFILAGTGSWRAVFWLTFAIGCLAIVLMLLFLDETWYRRDIPTSRQPARGTRLLRLIGVWQVRNHGGYFGTVYEGVRRVLAVLLKPIMPLIMLY